LVWDEKEPSAALAYLIGALPETSMPQALGVFRAVDKPVFDGEVRRQAAAITKKYGDGDLKSLLYSGDVWEVK
jgi:2-oxoglutarate ferredoxin oxidoreductase subunit beta